jgi:gluconokinase
VSREAGGPVLVVMGVSGSGKTTVGLALAARTGWAFLDADDLHSPDAVERMATGVPLTDEERWPWLDRVAEWIAARHASGEPAIVACSALKRTYRDRLRVADPDLRLVYLRAERQQIDQRLTRRIRHFFPQQLVASQFADLEEPGPDEGAITIPIGRTAGEQAEVVLGAIPSHRPRT